MPQRFHVHATGDRQVAAATPKGPGAGWQGVVAQPLSILDLTPGSTATTAGDAVAVSVRLVEQDVGRERTGEARLRWSGRLAQQLEARPWGLASSGGLMQGL